MRDAIFRTRVTDLFGIRHPILAGGLMWLADAAYVSAVVNSGGMGFITAKTFPRFEDFEAELDKAWRLTDGKPFGVNLYMSVRESRTRICRPSLRSRWTKVSGISNRRLAAAHLVERIKDAGAGHAQGGDGQACGLGGEQAAVGRDCRGRRRMRRPSGPQPHRHDCAGPACGPTPRYSLVVGGDRQWQSDHGGLAMGAEGVILGTRFLVADEVWSHDRVKQRVVDSQETDTALVLASMRNTFRGIDNETTRRIAELRRRANGLRGLPSLRGRHGAKRGLHRG